MTALFMVELTIKNADKLKEYSAQTPAVLKKYHGELLMKDKASQIHASTNPSVAYDTRGGLSIPLERRGARVV